jgi:hypothetical protein
MVRIEIKGKGKVHQPDTEEPAENYGQRRRPERGPFWLQVDRQTKETYTTFEEAAAAGLGIKQAHPIIQVAVYDTIKSENTLIELPAEGAPT